MSNKPDKGPFLIKWIERRVRDMRIWPKYNDARRSEERRLKTTGELKNPGSIRYQAAKTAAGLLGINLQEAEAIWARRRKEIQKKKNKRHREAAERILEIFERLHKQRLRRLDRLDFKLDYYEERVRIERKKFHFLRRTIEEAIMNTEERMKMEQEQHKATVPQPLVHYNGQPSDITRDVDWVYSNLAELLIVDSDGITRLNPGILAKAPSPGAITVASYAARNFDGFMEKFANKMMPQARPAAAEKAERAERLDRVEQLPATPGDPAAEEERVAEEERRLAAKRQKELDPNLEELSQLIGKIARGQ